MIQAKFRHRSGRVIALGRLVIAAVYLLAIYLDPAMPQQNPAFAYGLLVAYTLWAVIMLLLIWSDWWFDYRSSGIAHLIDIAAFGTLIFFTDGYTSPFYSFFVFLLLSSAIRWGWRETALTAAVIATFFLAAGGAAIALGSSELDIQRLVIRLFHLIILSVLFSWIGTEQRGSPTALEDGDLELQPGADGPPIQSAMQYAGERTKAKRVVLAWWQREEPWIYVAQLEGDKFTSERKGPGDLGQLLSDDAESCAFLFDRRRGRALYRKPSGSHRLRPFRQSFDPRFAEEYRIDRGLAIRIRGAEYEGELFALDIDGLCAEDLIGGHRIGKELSALFASSLMLADSEEEAFTRARMSLARDLHDSVVQVLAGAAFRLEALKSWIKAGRDAEPEIEAVKADLTTEQRNIRAFIASLRSGRQSMRQTDLRVALPDLCDQLERRWSLKCELTRPDDELVAPVWVEHELHQIVREAAANAARHGRATSLRIDLKRAGEEMELSISDNGVGFPSTGSNGGNAPSPWTVHERVKGLGGTLSLFSGGIGSRLQIRVPLEESS